MAPPKRICLTGKTCSVGGISRFGADNRDRAPGNPEKTRNQEGTKTPKHQVTKNRQKLAKNTTHNRDQNTRTPTRVWFFVGEDYDDVLRLEDGTVVGSSHSLVVSNLQQDDNTHRCVCLYKTKMPPRNGQTTNPLTN